MTNGELAHYLLSKVENERPEWVATLAAYYSPMPPIGSSFWYTETGKGFILKCKRIIDGAA